MTTAPIVVFPHAEHAAPWEQQARGSASAYHAFGHYREQRVPRSAARAWQAHRHDCEQRPDAGRATGTAPAHWRRWRVAWAWVTRSAAWDRDVDRQVRARQLQDQIDARVRHARITAATLAALSIPVRAVLNAAQDPALLATLVSCLRKSLVLRVPPRYAARHAEKTSPQADRVD